MALAGFLHEQGHRSCDLLTYNPSGIRKRHRICMTAPLDLPESFLDAGVEEELRDCFARSLAGQEPPSQRTMYPIKEDEERIL
jgi:hypothetical protein